MGEKSGTTDTFAMKIANQFEEEVMTWALKLPKSVIYMYFGLAGLIFFFSLGYLGLFYLIFSIWVVLFLGAYLIFSLK